MPGTPLPPATSPEVQLFAYDEPDSLSAYLTCLDFERQLATTERVRLVRILGYLLLYAPNRSVRHEVAKCIHSHKARSDLTDIGAFFEGHVIVAFKKCKGRTPASSENLSRPSFETTKNQMVIETPKDHKDAKEQALVRDNWRCVVTGKLHATAPADIIDEGFISDPHTVIGFTECAHIIPEATFFNIEPKEPDNTKAGFPMSLPFVGVPMSLPQLAYSASILAILRRFHYDISAFNGPQFHSLMNVMTMDKNIHDVFDWLELYFEATHVPNCYKIKTFLSRGRYDANQPEEVTLTIHNPETHPVPSPELLALHATCCKVAHLSGSSEYIDAVYRDTEEMGVLANDGTSGDILRYSLLSLANSTTAVGD